jgi:hypothetical protein
VSENSKSQFRLRTDEITHSYVQELENRLLKLEAVLTQVAPSVDLNDLPANSRPPSAGDNTNSQSVPAPLPPPPTSHLPTEPRSALGPSHPAPSAIDTTPDARNDESDEFVIEQMGTLALDDHGHLRYFWLFFVLFIVSSTLTFLDGLEVHQRSR